MDKMNNISNISFTGIKNIADIGFVRPKNTMSSALSMVLTDDLRGKDLTEFKSVIDKVAKKSKNFRHKDGVEFLNFEKRENMDVLDVAGSTRFYLNGKEVEVKDENLPIFSYLAKLTKKIANMDKKDMIINEDYKQFEASSKLVYGEDIDSFHHQGLDYPEYYNRFFDRNVVRDSAEEMNDLIQIKMEKYLDI